MVFPRLPSRVRRLRRGKGGGELPSLSTELSLRRLRDLYLLLGRFDWDSGESLARGITS